MKQFIHSYGRGHNNKKNHQLRRPIDLIVFSHLRWEFVFQRPQHLMTRLASKQHILFVEEPAGVGKVYEAAKNITVLQPRQGRNWVKSIVRFVQRTRSNNYDPLTAWFYTASFIDVLDHMRPFTIVYDCMDELSAFKGAPALLRSQERVLLQQADIVFTGGKSLYESKKELHDNVFCFPSSVDHSHFQRSSSPFTKVPAKLQSIPKPIALFYGVLDERLDTDLLQAIAWLKPDVSFVLLGPVVKIDPDSLPKAPNLYYLGHTPYRELPAYLKGADIAIMPFAINEATKYISPTKTLEYMAAGKPIISSPIYDVVRDYKETVSIATTPEEFVWAIDNYLYELPSDEKLRLSRYQQILHNTSWDKTAYSMAREIETVIDQKLAQSEQRTLLGNKLKYILNPFS